ncbi:MAG TPA: glycosyltransferase family 8 protein [Solirubrobacteraceae bacterium]|nr:glycosyltransferase family 8 protein [Solirubrobacteraceae bacterium]
MSTIHVACAADERYLPHCATALHSLSARTPAARIEVHLLHPPTLEPAHVGRLRSIADPDTLSIVAHAIEPSAVSGLPGWGRIPQIMWYRILLPELLPGVDRVLYLDCDVLVVEPLHDLWELDLESSYVAAVTNVPERHMLGHARRLGLAGPERYFNSGVLLMNLELMRRDRCSTALRDCALENRDRLLWPDQDALNLVLSDRRLDLHPRWNLMNSIRCFPWSRDLLDAAAVEQAVHNPAIVHFEGPRQNKPWHILCDHPCRDAYFAHRRQTPWPRVRREGITPLNLIRTLRSRAPGPRRSNHGFRS